MRRNRLLTVILMFASPASLVSVTFQASRVTLEYPTDVAVDVKGLIYIADPEAYSIFSVSLDKRVSILAKGKPTYRSPLYRVRGIALDEQGQVIAADPASSEVYRVSREGNPAPLGAGKLAQPMDVAVDAKGDVWVADLGNNAIYRISREGGLQRVAEVDVPRGLAVDKDNSLIVISNRGLVRVSVGGKVERITSKDAFEFPGFVAVLASGDYAVSDGYAKAIWKVSRDGKSTPLVKGGQLINPQGLAVGEKGEIFVADPGAKTIFTVSPTGQVSAIVKN